MAAVLPIDPRRLDGRLPTSRKNVTSASQKPSRQFGLERSGDRRDIGYARSGAAWVVPCRESPDTLEMLPALDRTAKNVSSSLRLPICREVALTRHRFWRQQTQLSPRSTSRRSV